MLLSSVTPRRDSDLTNAIRVVSSVADNLASLTGTSAEDRLNSYHAWASGSSALLRSALELETVEWLINTRRHDFLLAKPWADTQLLINKAISAEQEDRSRVLKALLDELRAMEASCARLPDWLVVPDTNVFLHQDLHFDELDWDALAGISANIRVMIPMAVVRELDKAKRAQKGKRVSDNSEEFVRGRARTSSKRLRELFADPHSVVQHAPKVTFELLMDPVGHRCHEDPDTEIIERALALKIVSARNVYIATGDGNMQFMADVAGLRVVALAE